MINQTLPPSFRKAILIACQQASEEWGDGPLEPGAGVSLMVATIATGAIANRLGINIESELDRAPRRERYTVEAFEKMVLKALSKRESVQSIANRRHSKEFVAEYIAQWNWDHQDWWRQACRRLGSDGCRCWMTGILRSLLHDHFKTNKIDAHMVEVLDALDLYGLTGERTTKINKLAIKPLRWKYNLRHLEAAVRILLCFPTLDSFNTGEAYGHIAEHANWKPDRAFAEAQMWFRSMVPEARKPIIKASWRSESAIEVCEAMVTAGAFDRFRELGKQLKLAGCDCRVVLDHCSNGKQRHVRADWLLTSILPNRQRESKGLGKTKVR